MNKPLRVVHFSTAHKPFDVRIFEKECRSLAEEGFDVHYVVREASKAKSHQITFHELNIPTSKLRLIRILKRLWVTYRTTRLLKADIYHFHDPELIPVGILLCCHAKVIYDVHEDAPVEALSINKSRPIRAYFYSFVWKFYEFFSRYFLHGFVAATPLIATHFPKHRTVLVQNFPRFISQAPILAVEISRPYFIYAGGLTRIRGIREIILALEHLPDSNNVYLKMFGEFFDPEFETEMRKLKGWGRVEYLGYRPHAEVMNSLKGANAGLVTLYPEPSYLVSQPIKLFEYMTVGIPVIASNFPFWRSLIGENETACGIMVDPLDPQAISQAMLYILEQPKQAKIMGNRGRMRVEKEMNWEREAKSLLSLYKKLAGVSTEV